MLTTQEEMAMRSNQGNKDVWLDIVSRPLDNVIQDFKEDKIESPRPPSRNFGTKAKIHGKTQAGSKNRLAIKNGKTESQPVIHPSQVAPFVQPIDVQQGEIGDDAGPVVLNDPSLRGGESFFPAVTAQVIVDKYLKPAGFVTAGAAGVGALVGVVWLFSKVKGFFNRKR